MFKNVGKAIKGIAKALFVIYLLFGAILAIVALVSGIAAGTSRYGSPIFILWGILGFIGILVFAFVIAYLSVMVLYAYGSITDDIKTIKDTLLMMNPNAAPTYNPQSANEPSPFTIPNPTDDYRPTTWQCNSCGHTNAFENAFCEECGAQKSV